MRMRFPAVFLAISALAGSGCLAFSMALDDQSTPARKKAGICLLAGLAELLVAQLHSGDPDADKVMDLRPMWVLMGAVDLTAAGFYWTRARIEERPAPGGEVSARPLPVDIAESFNNDVRLTGTRDSELRDPTWCFMGWPSAARAEPSD